MKKNTNHRVREYEIIKTDFLQSCKSKQTREIKEMLLILGVCVATSVLGAAFIIGLAIWRATL